MTEPSTTSHYLEVPAPQETLLIIAEVILALGAVGSLLSGDLKLAFVTGGLPMASLISHKMTCTTTLFGEDAVEVSGSGGGNMSYHAITTVLVRGRHISLIGDKEILEFDVRHRDVKKVLAEIEMRRGEFLTPS